MVSSPHCNAIDLPLTSHTLKLAVPTGFHTNTWEVLQVVSSYGLAFDVQFGAIAKPGLRPHIPYPLTFRSFDQASYTTLKKKRCVQRGRYCQTTHDSPLAHQNLAQLSIKLRFAKNENNILKQLGYQKISFYCYILIGDTTKYPFNKIMSVSIMQISKKLKNVFIANKFLVGHSSSKGKQEVEV